VPLYIYPGLIFFKQLLFDSFLRIVPNQKHSYIFPRLTRSTNHTRELNSIVHHVVQHIKLALQPPIQQHLILTNKRASSRRKHFRAFFELVDVVYAKEGKTSISFRIVLS
jgi:hypothetical protein